MYCVQCNVETVNPKFCSRKCACTHKNIHTKRKLKAKCKKCLCPVRSGRSYCPKCWISCRSGVLSNRRTINSKSLKNCQVCGKEILKYSRQCCSPQCGVEYKFLKRAAEVELVGSFYANTKFNTSTSFVKNYLKRKHGNICSICNIDALWNNQKLVLVLDHINGKPNDWSISNLRLVCPNCDSQLPTFKSKNTGNGGRPRK